MKKSFLSMLAAVVVFSIVAVGCGKAEEPAATTGAGTQQQTTTDDAADANKVQDDAKALEKSKLKAISAARIAEEKVTSIFETKTVGDKDVLVAKSTYPTIDDVKGYWSFSMSDNFVNEYAANLKEEELPELGKVVTLTLPEDYVSINDISFSDVDLNNVTVDGDKSTVTVKVNDKTLTYELVKKDDSLVLDKKTVQ